MNTKSYTCQSCRKTIQYEPHIMRSGDELPAPETCELCQEKREATEKRRLDQEWMDRRWAVICPPLYRDTDLERLPPEVLNAVEEYDGLNGLGFVGPSGLCKTRAAFLALRSRHYQGKKCFYVRATQIHRAMIQCYSGNGGDAAWALLEKVRTVEYLLLDDLAKNKMTESAQQEFYDLLEDRTIYKRPLIWTANCGALELASMLTKDRADSILRRLFEFSKIVNV